MAITDLTNTTWVVPAGWSATQELVYFVRGELSIGDTDYGLPSTTALTVNTSLISFANGAWDDNININPSQSFTITFETVSAQSGYTVEQLISWLETYGELQAPPVLTTPTTITYNGSTIASLFGGQTATLKCGGMKMETDLVVEVAEPDPVLQEKTATENGEVTPDEGYDGLSKVTVNVPETIPDGYIKPSGTKSVTANGVHDVGSFANVNVSVPVGVFPSGTKEITENGTHDVTEFASVTVNVPAPVLTYYDGTVTISGGEETVNITLTGSSVLSASGSFNSTSIKFGSAPTSDDDWDYATVGGGDNLYDRDRNVYYYPDDLPVSLMVSPVAYVWQSDVDSNGGYRINGGSIVTTSTDYTKATEVTLKAGDAVVIICTYD